MGRKQKAMRGGGDHNLSVRIPSFFRCPISLDVMKSPVSLCTGVTYDRSSIQRWLDSGNNTCPATMQPLPSTDLVPNLTLQRLIHIWSQSRPVRPSPARSLLADIRSPAAADPAPSLLKLAAFFADADADEFEKNQIIASAGCAEALASLFGNNIASLETLEAAAGVIARILISDCIAKENKQIVISTAICRDLDESVSSLIRVLKDGRSVECRSDAATVVNAVLTSSNDSKHRIAEKKDLIPQLMGLIGSDEEAKLNGAAAIDAGISCLVPLSAVRKARISMVRLGIVPLMGRILSEDTAAAAAEKAMKLLEAASGCSEGREAICTAAETAISGILKRMMKVGRAGTEAAVIVLWSVCYLFRDRRAQEAVEGSGGVAKILVLMQSNCSPAVRQMAGDLLKIFRVGAKCCLAGYDTKTTHIMPF